MITAIVNAIANSFMGQFFKLLRDWLIVNKAKKAAVRQDRLERLEEEVRRVQEADDARDAVNVDDGVQVDPYNRDNQTS